MSILPLMDQAPGLASRVFIALGIILLYPLGLVVYNLYFHPLSRIPGPKTWAATRLTFIRSVWKGSLVHDVQKIHRQYGDIVRLAPDEVSFARGEAWSEIFGHRPGHLPFPKNPVWWSPPQGQTPSLLHVQDEGAHARMRRVLAHSFTEKALRTQEPLIQSYVDLLIKRLRERTAENTHSEGTVLDIVQWYNYTTFDIIGDLGLGQSFDCLQQSTLHPWVAMIYNFFKVSTYLATVRFYPSIEFLLRKCIPKSALKMQRDHYQLVVDRVDRRMNLETQRDDFMSQLLKHNDKTGMSVDEIRSTFNTLIVAGSETTATVLSGITNYLVQNTGVLQKLVQEIRGPFEEEKNITIGSLQTLAYLNAVIEEGLRLCPPVPAGLPRVVPAGGDTVCGQWLPEHTNVSVPQWTLSNSAENFASPTSFIPERWLSSAPVEFASDKAISSQPLSVGPRSCIGKNLAYAEMRLILARVLWNFDIAVPNEGKSVMTWASQKTYMLVEKQPFEVRLTTVRHYLASV